MVVLSIRVVVGALMRLILAIFVSCKTTTHDRVVRPVRCASLRLTESLFLVGIAIILFRMRVISFVGKVSLVVMLVFVELATVLAKDFVSRLLGQISFVVVELIAGTWAQNLILGFFELSLLVTEARCHRASRRALVWLLFSI